MLLSRVTQHWTYFVQLSGAYRDPDRVRCHHCHHCHHQISRGHLWPGFTSPRHRTISDIRERKERGGREARYKYEKCFLCLLSHAYKRYLQQEKWIVDPLFGRHCLKSINKMTFNWKVKIGSLLTAWHRYRVMDLPISIPRVSNTLSSQGPNYRLFICKIKRKWLKKGE